MSKLEKLAKTYRNWCARNYLPVMGAEELLCEVALSDDQCAWVHKFQEKWGNAC